ncbi:titin [Drosophila obscura]|uniref:titin n=1 Tax=Drosophila obscura TaxID=7282 RepID=UPI001BB15FFD|nr:titin [Drosophila obscura]
MREETKQRLWMQMKKKYGEDRLSEGEWKKLKEDFLQSWNKPCYISIQTMDKLSKDQLAEAALREKQRKASIAPDQSMPVPREHAVLENGEQSLLLKSKRRTKLETNPTSTHDGSTSPSEELTDSLRCRPSLLSLDLCGPEKEEQSQSSKTSQGAVKAQAKPVATPDGPIPPPREHTGLEKGGQKRSSKPSHNSVKADIEPRATPDVPFKSTQKLIGPSKRKPKTLSFDLQGSEKAEQSLKPSYGAVETDGSISPHREAKQSIVLKRRSSSRGGPEQAPTPDGPTELEKADQKRTKKPIKAVAKSPETSEGSIQPARELTGSSNSTQRRPNSSPLLGPNPEKVDKLGPSKLSDSSVSADGSILPSLENTVIKKEVQPRRLKRIPSSRGGPELAATHDGDIPPVWENTGPSKRRPKSILPELQGPEKEAKSLASKRRPSCRGGPEPEPAPAPTFELKKAEKLGPSKLSDRSVKAEEKPPATPDADILPTTPEGSTTSSPELKKVQADISRSLKHTNSDKQRTRILKRRRDTLNSGWQRKELRESLDDLPLSEWRNQILNRNGTKTDGKNRETIENHSPKSQVSPVSVKRKPPTEPTITIPMQPIKRRRQTHVPISRHLESIRSMPEIEMGPTPIDLRTDILEESEKQSDINHLPRAVQKNQDSIDLEKAAELVEYAPELADSTMATCWTEEQIDLSNENNVDDIEIPLFELDDEGDRTPDIDRCLKIFTSKTPSEIDDELANTTEFFERLPNSSTVDLEKADLMLTGVEEEVLDYEEDRDDDVLSVTATSWDGMDEVEKKPETTAVSLRNYRIPRITSEVLKSQPKIMRSLYIKEETLNEKEQAEPQKRILTPRKSSGPTTSIAFDGASFVLDQHEVPPPTLPGALPLEATPIMQSLYDQKQSTIGHNAYSVPPVRTPIIHTLNGHAQSNIEAQTLYSVPPPTALSLAVPLTSSVRTPIIYSTNNQEERQIQEISQAHNQYPVPSSASVAPTLYSAPAPIVRQLQDNPTLIMPAATVTPSLGNPRAQALAARHVTESQPKFDPPYRASGGMDNSSRASDNKWFSCEYLMVNLFGIKCYANLDDECTAQSCNHTFTAIAEVTRKLMRLDENTLVFTYHRIVMHSQRLFLTFASVYVDVFDSLNLQTDLFHLLMTCRLYKPFCASIISKVFSAMKSKGLETQATRCIMEYLWMPSKAHEFREITLTILQLLATSNWYIYTDNMVELCQTQGFYLPPEILITILSSTNGRPELKHEAIKLLWVMRVGSGESNAELKKAIEMFGEQNTCPSPPYFP